MIWMPLAGSLRKMGSKSMFSQKKQNEFYCELHIMEIERGVWLIMRLYDTGN